MTNPLTARAKHNIERENLLISIACGIVLAALTIAFII